jgi:hypothetical protein
VRARRSPCLPDVPACLLPVLPPAPAACASSSRPSSARETVASRRGLAAVSPDPLLSFHWPSFPAPKRGSGEATVPAIRFDRRIAVRISVFATSVPTSARPQDREIRGSGFASACRFFDHRCG